MREKIYKKVGRRYKPVGHEFVGFPSDGVWLVQDGRENCILKLSEIKEVPVNALPYVELAARFFEEEEITNCSPVEFAKKLALYFAKKAQNNPANIEWEEAPF